MSARDTGVLVFEALKSLERAGADQRRMDVDMAECTAVMAEAYGRGVQGCMCKVSMAIDRHSTAIHAVAMSYHRRLGGRVDECAAPCLEALFNLPDAPGGHGLMLCRICIVLESLFRGGTLDRVRPVHVLVPPMISRIATVRWRPVPDAVRKLLRDSYKLHV